MTTTVTVVCDNPRHAPRRVANLASYEVTDGDVVGLRPSGDRVAVDAWIENAIKRRESRGAPVPDGYPAA